MGIRGPPGGTRGRGRAQGGRAHPHPRGWWVAPLWYFLRSIFFLYHPGRAPCLVGPLVALRCPSSAIWSLSLRKKNHKQAFGTRLRRHEAEPWRNQSRALVELFCRGHIPPGGRNHLHRHHQRSSHREGSNLHQHLHQHHLLSNPSSSLVSNSCL